jgi:hypothetical protein
MDGPVTEAGSKESRRW